jgi:hypothetical protein
MDGLIVCGTYPRSKVTGSGADCPVCHAKGSVDLLQSYQRCCICFLPLCIVGGKHEYASCEYCGSRMPAATARRQMAAQRLAAADAAGAAASGGYGSGAHGRPPTALLAGSPAPMPAGYAYSAAPAAGKPVAPR